MYNVNGTLQHRAITLFSAESMTRPNCAWFCTATGKWFVGTVTGRIWQYLENAWANDTYGNWAGPFPSFTQPVGLWVIDADGEGYTNERQGDDLVCMVPTGQALRVVWSRQTLPGTYVDTTNSRIRVYSAVDGSLVLDDTPSGAWYDVGTLPDGSYTIHVVYENIADGLRIPLGAYRDPSYDYTTQDDRLSHYNPDQNWGEVPADPEHPLRLERIERVKTGTNHDVIAWSYYLTAEEPHDGEGAILKVQVGGGTWTAASDVFVSPARPLHAVDNTPLGDAEGTPTAIPFDPCAAQISFYKKTIAGRVLLGGARMDTEGTHPAVWEWDEANETWELLATARVVSRGVCEQRLSVGGVTGIEERVDGRIVVLTLCSRHILDETMPTHEERMPRYPISADGEPGGRSLVAVQNTVTHLTERFSRDPDPETQSFYNVLIDVRGERMLYSAGTIAHLDGALWKHLGRCYGVRADGFPTEPGTNLFIAWYSGMWSRTAFPWRADWLFLQRGVSVNGRMLVFGFIPDTETSRVVLSDGRNDRVFQFGFRVRQGFLTDGVDSDFRQCAMAARKVVSSTELGTDWYVISVNGNVDPIIVVTEDGEGGSCAIDLGVGDIDMPTYIIWDADLGKWYASDIPPVEGQPALTFDGENCYTWTEPGGGGLNGCNGFEINATTGEVRRVHLTNGVVDGYCDEEEPRSYRTLYLPASVSNPVYGIHVTDCTGGVLQLNNKRSGNTLVRARVDSADPVDDLSTYVYCVPVGEQYILPIEAYDRVDIVVEWPDSFGALDLPIVGQCA